VRVSFSLAVSAAMLSAFLAADPAGCYNHSELKWRTITTEHFLVHYHEGEELTAERASEIAEKVYGPVTRLYQYEPSLPVHLTLRDTDDLSNGAAYFYENKIEIWASNRDFILRGTNDWLWDVITHEFIHIVSIQSAMRFGVLMPGLYLQFFGYENEKRTDVLVGYPDRLVAVPLAGINIPNWFAEGLSQFQTSPERHDVWDSRRDMLLRVAVLNDELLSFDDMGVFGKNTIGSEMVYNQGFSLVRFIGDRYGEGALRELCVEASRLRHLDFNGVMKRVLKADGETVYRRWVDEMRQRYEAETADIRVRMTLGERLPVEGYLNIQPRFSPGGGRITYLSNAGNDYFGTSLYLLELDTGKRKLLEPGVSSPGNWSPDGSKLTYAKRKKNKYGSMVSDIYLYDLETGKEKRMTRGQRAADPCFSAEGGELFYVRNGDGTNNLWVLDLKTGVSKALTSFPYGTEVYAPSSSPRTHKVLFSLFHGDERDIAALDPETGDLELLSYSAEEERDPVYGPGGRTVYFSSDKGGISNIWRLDLASGRASRITNVIGGAFMPTVAGGRVIYSSYEKDGFVLRILEEASGGSLGESYVTAPRALLLEESPRPSLASAPYAYTYGKAHLYPRILSDDGKIKVGFYASSDEVLGKRSAFVGFDYGQKGEYDIFGSLEDRTHRVTLFADGYSVRKRAIARDSLLIVRNGARQWVRGELDLKYDVGGVTAGVKMEWEDPLSRTRRNALSLSYSYDNQGVSFYAYDDSGSYLGKTGWTYFAGRDIQASWQYRSVRRAVDSEINPRGREVFLRADYYDNSLLQPPQYAAGGFFTPRDRYRYYQFTYDHREFIPVPFTRHTLGIRITYSTLDRPVDDFFWIRMGGMDYLRGYTYYSIEGQTALLSGVSYRFPLVGHIGKSIGPVYLHQLYGELFADRVVWDEHPAKDLPAEWLADLFRGGRSGKIRHDKRSVGAGIRLKLFTSYSFGNSFYVQAAYSLGSAWPSLSWFRNCPAGDPERRWTYYWGLLFNFPDFGQPGRGLSGRFDQVPQHPEL